MIEGTEDQLKVSFPASPAFTRVGRVAVAGLALRLGVDIATVEKLRAAVDTAVAALLGAGRIDMLAAWQPEGLRVSLSNPDSSIDRHGDLADELAGLVGKATVDDTAITLELRT